MKSQNEANWNVEPTAQNSDPVAVNDFAKQPGKGKSPGSRPFLMAIGSLMKRVGKGKSPGSRPF